MARKLSRPLPPPQDEWKIEKMERAEGFVL
jgi:hypothetical protein